MFKIGDRVVLVRGHSPDELHRVVSVSGSKRTNVKIDRADMLFDESGSRRGGGDWNTDRIRLATPEDIARIQLERMTRDLGRVEWEKVSEDKRRRIASILKETD